MREDHMKADRTTSRKGNTGTSDRLAPKKKPITKDNMAKKEKRSTTDKEKVVSDVTEATEVATEEKEAATERREATTGAAEAAEEDKKEMPKTPSEASKKLDLNEFSGIMEEEAAITRRGITKSRTSQTWAEMGFKW